MPICPICNGLNTIDLLCERCSTPFLDKGSIECFFDSYSPYLDEEILDLLDGVASDFYCVHLLYCPKCKNKVERTISKNLL